MYNDSSNKIVKFILILIIIGLVIYLLNRDKKTEFKMNEILQVGNVEICFNNIQVIEKLKPANATEDSEYFKSPDKNKIILDISGTVKNITEKEVILRDELTPSSMIINGTKYDVVKMYENEAGTDFLEDTDANKATIKPFQTLRIHYLLIINKSIIESNKTVEVLIEENYSMTTGW